MGTNLRVQVCLPPDRPLTDSRAGSQYRPTEDSGQYTHQEFPGLDIPANSHQTIPLRTTRQSLIPELQWLRVLKAFLGTGKGLPLPHL